MIRIEASESWISWPCPKAGVPLVKIRISNRLHPTPRGAQMGWNRVMPEVMRSFFADFRAWPKEYRFVLIA